MTTDRVPEDSRSLEVPLHPDMSGPRSPHPWEDPTGDEIDLRAAWRAIVRYRWTIAAIVVGVVLLTLVATLVMRPVYRGEAVVEIAPSLRSSVGLVNVDGGVVESRAREYLETQWRILRSESVAAAVISRLALPRHPEFADEASEPSLLSRLLTGGGDSGEEAESAALRAHDRDRIARFIDRVHVEPVRDSNLVVVAFDSFDPALAARGANAIVEEYVRLSNERHFRSSSGAKEFFEAELEQVEYRLEQSERKLNHFARRHGIVDIDEKTGLITERISDLSSKLTQAVSDRIAAEALRAQFRSASASEIPAALRSEVVIEFKKERVVKLAEHERLSAIFKPDYPKLAQARAEVLALDRAIQAEIDRVAASVAGEASEARGRERLFAEELERSKHELLDVKDKAVPYHILKRDWEANAELHAGLLERIKELGVSAGMQISTASMIDAAKIPLRHHHPRVIVTVPISLAVGLALGLALTFLRHYLDDGLRSIEDLEAVSGLTAFGIVPKVEAGQLADEFRLRAAWSSPYMEALRSVRMNLLETAPAEYSRTTMVTSAGMGEGKTTIAAGLAVALARSGFRVLLIDADLRRPRSHHLFGLPGRPGLSEWLLGSGEKPVTETEVDGLWLVPAGKVTEDPANLLGKLDLEKLAEELGGEFDHVIVDSAPVLGLADAPILSTKVDGVLLVVSADDARRPAVRDALRRLRLVRAPLLGAILNNADGYNSNYGYQRDQYHSYGS